MNPKEKAADLIDKFLDYAWGDLDSKTFAKSLRENAIECALICTDEMIETSILTEYWKQVKEEIHAIHIENNKMYDGHRNTKR